MDDMTPGEIRRSIERIERSHQDGQRAVDDRLAEVARKSVPLELWAAEHKALGDDVKHLESDFREAVERIERTSQERMTTLRGEIKTIRTAQSDHEKQHRESGAWSRSRTLTVIAIIVGASATIIGAWIAAFAAAGGVGR